MRILAVTNMLPTAENPSKGTFVEQQIKGIRDKGVHVDVLHIDRVGLGPSTYSRTVRVVRSRVTQARPNLIHVMYGGVMALLVTRGTRSCPTVVSYCGSDLLGTRQGPPAFRLRTAVGVLASHAAARRADSIIVKSRGLQLALPEGTDASRVRIIPNGIDLGRFRPLDSEECRQKLGWEPDVFHILFPTSDRRAWDKRLPLAEAAVASLNRMGVRAQMHGLTGVAHDEVPVWLNAADVLLLTSDHEGSPNVVKEALGCNRPVVSVDVGDVRERIQGIEGCFIAEPTPDDLAAKLASVSTGPRVVNGRAKMHDLSLERVATRLLELYDAALTRWRRGEALSVHSEGDGRAENNQNRTFTRGRAESRSAVPPSSQQKSAYPRMRIAYVTAGLPYSSGQEAFFIPEITELTRRGHRLLIVPREKMGLASGAEARQLLGAARALPLLAPDVLLLAFSEFLRRPMTCVRDFRTFCSRGGVVKRAKNLAVCPKALWLAKTAREFGANHIHVQWLGTTATMALVAHHLTGIPWSVTAHRGDIASNNLLEEKVRDASFVRFISNKSMALAQSLCSFDISSKSFVLHLGVRMPDGECASATGRASRTLICPANMIPVKGHKYLLEAMAILRRRQVECELVLAGDGPLRKRLEKTAQALGVADIARFVGRLSHEGLLSLYRKGEVGLVVLPSVDLGDGEHEGIPISLVEAMAHGVPVVSTETGGIPELLADGCGLLVPGGESTALADAVARGITDDGLRRDLTVKGHQRAVEEYAVEKVVDELERRIETAQACVD